MSNIDDMPPFLRAPKRTVEFDFTARQANIVDDFRNTQDIPDKPLRLNCDFCCNSVDRLWFYPTRAFCVSLLPGKNVHSDESWWGACVFCRPLFEGKAWAALVARVRTLTDLPTPNLERLYSAVSDTIFGELEEWKSGELRVSKRPGFPSGK